MKNNYLSFLKNHPLTTLLLIALIFYIIWIWLPLGVVHSWNEAYYILRVNYVSSGGSYLDGPFDNPPLFAYTLAFLSKIFGNSLIAFRIFIVFCTLITTYLVYQIGCIFSNKKIALIASCLYAFFPMTILFAKIIQIDIFAIMLITASFYFAILGTTKKTSWFFLSGIFLGLTLLTKFPAVLIAIPIFYFLYLKKVELKYFLLIIIVTTLVPLPWLVYVLQEKHSFLTSGSSSSTNFFGLGSMHADAPAYQLAMIVLALLVFVGLLILSWKYRPKNIEEKTLVLFTLIFSGFFVLLPNHEYYLLPVFVPLFLYLAIKFQKNNKGLKRLVYIFLIISLSLLVIRPIYDVNWEEATDYVKENFQDDILIYSTSPLVTEYYFGRTVNWIHPNIFSNATENKTILMFTVYDKINLESTGLMKEIQNNFVFVKSINDKIFIYESKDLR